MRSLMPGSGVEDRIHNLYKLDYSYISQPVLDDRNLVGKRQNFDAVGKHVIESLEVSRGISRHELFNTDLVKNRYHAYDLMFGRECDESVENQANIWDETSSYASKGFFQDYASGDSPTITTNSERSEITETSTEFNHLGGPRQLGRGEKQHNILRAQSMQQPGYSDMQFVQQHVMLKQLPRDSSLVDGIPNDAPSKMFMNKVHRDAFFDADGASDRLVFCHDQSRNFYQTSTASQQPDGALYGMRGIMAVNSQHQGMMGNDSRYYSGKSIGFAPIFRGLGGEVRSKNIDLGNTQKNYLFPDVSSRQDEASWPEILEQKKAPPQPSLGLVPLDPIEEKILYNTEDNVWDASFGRQNNDDGAGGFGSWSALMQSAVAEASGSDNGVQEEWSGLTFQNTELSSENQPSNLIEREKIRASWVDNNLQSPSSSSSRQFSALNDSVIGSSFPQQLAPDRREHLRQEDSWESIQKSFINSGEWLTPFSERSQQAHPLKDLNSRWADQILEQSESDTHAYQHQTASYDNASQPRRERGVNENTFNRNETDGFRWKTDGDGQQLDYMKNPDSSADEDAEARGSNYNRMSNGSIAMQNSYKLAGQTYFEEKNRGAKSYDDHRSSMKSQERRQGFLTVPSRNAKALDEMAAEGDVGASANFSFARNGQNGYGKNSHNMLKLLHKVDQSKDNSFIPHFHSAPSSTLPAHTEEGVANTLFNKQQNLLSTSQGFSSGLAPSSQNISPRNLIHSAYTPLSTRGLTNIRLGNAHSLTSNESSENAHWDEKSNTSSLHMQGDSVAAFASNPQYGRNQLQMQVASTHLSSRASLPAMGNQLITDNCSEQYPVLEAQPVSQSFRMPGMSQPGELSMRQPNMWKNKSTMEANKAIPGESERRTISPSIDSGRFQHSENNIATASGRNDESSGKLVKPSRYDQNYPLIQDMKNIGLDGSSRLKNNLTNFIRGTGDNPTMLTSLQPPQADMVSRGSAPVGQNQSQTHYGSTIVALSSGENAPHEPHFVSSWFKQYGGSRNGLVPMLPTYNPSVNLHAQSSLDMLDTACASQSGAAFLTSIDPSTAPHFHASDVSSQNVAMLRSKKRKPVSYDLLPWHEEVKQGSPRSLSISMVEQAWAESTSRLIDEVGDEFELVEDRLLMYRSKRRLTLTAQLMQQLLLPAPVSFLSADVSSFYDSVAYFVARLSLGDACSLICNAGKDCNNSMNDDESLDKAMSVLNIRVECEELERFSIINRFAKFHVRQADETSSSGFSANTSKTCLQRYVTANPMPMNLPEEVQCLSL